MAASVMASSLSLKPAPFTVEKSAARGLPSLAKTSFKIVAKGAKIKTDKPFGIFFLYHSAYACLHISNEYTCSEL